MNTTTFEYDSSICCVELKEILDGYSEFVRTAPYELQYKSIENDMLYPYISKLKYWSEQLEQYFDYTDEFGIKRFWDDNCQKALLYSDINETVSNLERILTHNGYESCPCCGIKYD